MKRSDFLKRLGIGLGVAVITPQVLAEINFPQDERTGDLLCIYPGNFYYLGDTFVRNGHKYICISKLDDILTLRPISPSPDICVKASDLSLNSFIHTKESVLLKFNND